LPHVPPASGDIVGDALADALSEVGLQLLHVAARLFHLADDDEVVTPHVTGERSAPLHLVRKKLPDIRDHGIGYGKPESLAERLEAVEVEITDRERLPLVA